MGVGTGTGNNLSRAGTHDDGGQRVVDLVLGAVDVHNGMAGARASNCDVSESSLRHTSVATPTQPSAPVDRLNVGSSPNATSSPWRRGGGAGGGASPDQSRLNMGAETVRWPRRYALMTLLSVSAEPLCVAGEAMQGLERGCDLGDSCQRGARA